MPYTKVVKVDDETYEKLIKFKKVFNAQSPNQVIKKLIQHFEKSGAEPVFRGNPLDKVITCIAEKPKTSLDIYLVRCKDGRQALIPVQHLHKLVSMLGDTIEIVE